jgi:hypothetical protein
VLTTCHEWIGASIPKKLAALLTTDFCPVASICSKYVVTLDIINQHFTELSHKWQKITNCRTTRKKVSSRSQHTPTTRQASGHSCRTTPYKESISVLIYLDIKNAFNAMNRRSIFYMLEIYGFPQADVDLFRGMYNGFFLVMVNVFGTSAACFLSRGVPQGAPPSSSVFSVVFDPVHVIIRASSRGVSIPVKTGTITTGSSGLADDTGSHRDRPG